jgi:histidinol-phosphate aminotransferase
VIFLTSLSYDDYAPTKRAEGVIDLSMVENPWGPSPVVLRSLKENLSHINKYYPCSSELLELIASSANVSYENVMLTDGADGALTLIFLALVKGRKTTIPLPSFPRFHYYCALAQSNLVPSPLDEDFKIREETILASRKNKQVFAFCNPNNPTGIEASKSFIEEALDKFELVIIDEALLCFGDGASQLLQDHDNLVIVRSFSKLLGLAGMRIGYALGSKSLITKLSSYSSPFKVSALSQIAALATLKDQEYISRSMLKLRTELRKLSKLPRKSTVVNSKSLCYLAKLEPGDLGTLKRAKIKVTPAHHFDYLDDSYARISIGKAKENLKLMRSLS